MGDRRTELDYAKGDAPSAWKVAPLAAFAAVFFAFPLLDYFGSQSAANRAIQYLDICMLLVGACFVYRIVRLYRK